ncbi:MAG: phosphohistidine phosphatase SixA [Rhodothermales bacterium]
MLLYLLRHGIAGPVAPGRDDAARTLTPEGVRLLKQQARAFKQAGFRVDRLVCSPLVRARQTAALVAPAWGVEPEEDALLRPGCSLEDVAEVWERHGRPDRVLLVGHQPDMGVLVRALTGSNARMRTGMMAVIETPVLRPTRGILIGLYDPEVTAHLAPHS